MKIAVVWRESLNPESVLSIESGELSWGKSTFVSNPFDEFALESVLRCKVSTDSIHVVGWGPPSSKNSLRQALALGAGHAHHFETPTFSSIQRFEIESFARWVEAFGIEAVVLGCQHPDWDESYLPAQIAGRLRWKLNNEVDDVNLEAAEFERKLVRTVVPVTRNRIPVRRPDLKRMMAARKMEIETLESSAVEPSAFVLRSIETSPPRTTRHIWTWESEETGKAFSETFKAEQSWGARV